MSRPAIFFDRDGTLSHEIGYVNHVTRFAPFAFAVDAIRAVNAGNRLAVVVTNQAGVARGYFPESLIAEVNGVLKDRAESSGARIDGIDYCPHHPSAAASIRPGNRSSVWTARSRSPRRPAAGARATCATRSRASGPSRVFW